VFAELKPAKQLECEAGALAVKRLGELFGRADSPTFAAGGSRIGAKVKIFASPGSPLKNGRF